MRQVGSIFEAGQQASFERDAEQVLTQIRSVLSDLLGSLPERAHRPQEVTRVLKVDKKLGWKVANLVQTPDPFELAQHVPGRSGLKILLTAAKNRKVPQELLDRVQAAIHEYDRLIEVHAGDRATLEMMLVSRAKQGRERVDLEHRRAAFRSNSYIWGIQAKTQFRTYFLHPSEQEGLFDLVSLRGFVGLRRIRSGVPFALHRAKVVDDDGVQRRTFQSEWLDSEAAPEDSCGVPLLREFCTKPLPKVRRVTVRPGLVDYEIVEGQVGNTAMSTCVMGELVRGAVPRYREAHNERVELAMRVNTPCERLIFDQIIHRELFPKVDPRLSVYSELTGETPPLQLAQARIALPVFEQVNFLGRGRSILYSAEVPRYSEIADFVFNRFGWDSQEWDIYRVTMDFPPIPTSVVVSTDLPSPPS